MTVAAPTLRRTPTARGLAGRMVRAVTRGPARIALIVIGAAWLMPTAGLFIASLRDPTANARSGWWNALTAPAEMTLDNYRDLLGDTRIVRSLLNTVLITVPSTILVILLAAGAAYAFAWIRFRGRDVLFLGVIAMLVVPIQVGLIPVARLFGDIGIFGKIPGVVLFHVAFGLPFAIFLLRNFFVGIPGELLEAARMDGAGELRIFATVILPLGLPAIASLAIFQFLWVWNDLLVALVFASPDAAPITVAIQQQTRQFGANLDVIAPGAFLSMILPLIVFFSFQRYFVQGLLAGSQK